MRHHLHQVAEHVGVGGAGHGGTQGQVDGVTAQDDGILDGGHVVGIEGAAVAEDLHGQNLGIGSHALHHDRAGSLGIAAAAGDEAVGGGDTGNVGAVLALLVVVVDDVQGGVHIVEAVGQLLGAGQLLGGDAGHPLGGMELIQHRSDVIGIQQVQGGHVAFQTHALSLGIFRQGVQICTVVKGLVIGVGTGIHNGDAGARAGVAAAPQIAGADHGGAGVGVGDQLLVALRHGGAVLGLHGHGLNAVNGGDLLQGAVGHPGGDDVAHQGHVPDHVQGTAVQSPVGDGLLHPLLGGQKLGPVIHGLRVCGDAHGGIARLHGGGLLQHDGHADHLAGFSFCCAVLLNQTVSVFCGDLQICLVPDDLCRTGCRNKRQHHAHNEHPGNEPLEGMFHFDSLLCFYFLFRISTLYPMNIPNTRGGFGFHSPVLCSFLLVAGIRAPMHGTSPLSEASHLPKTHPGRPVPHSKDLRWYVSCFHLSSFSRYDISSY